MQGLFKSVFSKLSGYKPSKNKHPIPHIDGAESLVVDSSVLCCPVCYNVYSCVPCVLRCGHTFCGQCVRTIARSATACSPDVDVSFQCPLCRESVNIASVSKNFLVEDLLKSVEALADEDSLKHYVAANMRVTKERFEQRCLELEQANFKLTGELADQKKQERHNYAVLAIAFVFFMILNSIFG